MKCTYGVDSHRDLVLPSLLDRAGQVVMVQVQGLNNRLDPLILSFLARIARAIVRLIGSKSRIVIPLTNAKVKALRRRVGKIFTVSRVGISTITFGLRG